MAGTADVPHGLHACAGLSASLYTSLYSGFLAPDATAFLLLLAILPTLTVLSSLHFVNYVPYVPQCEDPTATGTTPRGVIGACSPTAPSWQGPSSSSSM